MIAQSTGAARLVRSPLWFGIGVALAANGASRSPPSAELASATSARIVAVAASVVVENCDDSGPGSLRDAIVSAVDGGTIDFSHLQCSEITLTSGPLTVIQSSLTLIGPGSAALTVSGNRAQPVVSHSGEGTLTIRDVAIAGGLNRGANIRGGCVYSYGHLYFAHAAVHDCIATGVETALGGGAFGRLGIDATDSAFYANSALATSGALPNGAGGGLSAYAPIALTESYVGRNTANVCGGISAPYGLRMRDTTIAGNHASATGAFCVTDGQIDETAVDIESSSIIDNEAGFIGGAFFYGSAPPAPPMRLVNSTVSGNRSSVDPASSLATGLYGGLYVKQGVLEIANSTIAFNTCVAGAAGLLMIQADVRLDSSIVANNTYIDASASTNDIDGTSGTITGSANLVTYSRLSLPVDTIETDPLLLPLADNGGVTKTHALAPASPAIDAGSNPLALPWDQRGDGYPRTVGSASDIGAFELPQDNHGLRRGHSQHARPETGPR